mmetsp:Transcript_123638/g.308965  ORF Transcript_123638/g.308965 Transcript_123638/m.308965 type:complete len:265 (-) Transcript_123638:510-1304(-)
MSLTRLQTFTVERIELGLHGLDRCGIHLLSRILLCIDLGLPTRRAPFRHLEVQCNDTLFKLFAFSQIGDLEDEGVAIRCCIQIFQRLGRRRFRIPICLNRPPLCACPEILASALLNLITGVDEVQDRRDEIFAIVVKGYLYASIEIDFRHFLIFNETLDHCESFKLLCFAHGRELLKKTSWVVAKGFILLRSKLHVVRKIRLLSKLNTMQRQVWEAAQRAHSDLRLVGITFNTIIVAFRQVRHEDITVALGAKCAGFQERETVP